MSSRRFSLGIALFLTVLLTTLAALQYRWTGELSRAEKERLEATLNRSLRDFSEDFNREVGRVVFHFLTPGISELVVGARFPAGDGAPFPAGDGAPPPSPLGSGLPPSRMGSGLPPTGRGAEGSFDERFASWKDEPYSALLRDLYVAGDGDELKKLNRQTGSFMASDWPAELEAMKQRWQTGEPAPMGPLSPTVPVLALPVPMRASDGVGPGRAQLVFLLDLPFIRNELLPDLVGRHFGEHPRDYILAVFAGNEVVYQSDPDVDLALFQKADAEAGLFSLPRGGRPGPPRPDSPEPNRRGGSREPNATGVGPRRMNGDSSPRRELDDPELIAGGPRREPEFGGPPRRRGPGFFDRFRVPRPPPGDLGRGLWTVRVTNRAGSLDAAVQKARTRNLAVSFGVLALLGASVVLVVVSSHRARELALRQVEFVAGVSHELRTPLSVIRSAAQNLAEGAVHDRAQVASYGALIEREGRRLSEMVEEVLDFATPQSARAQRFVPVAVGDVVDSAVEASDSLLKEERILVEKNVPKALPLVKGDAAALSRALENLIVNAVKYGGDARWVGIKACEAPGEVSVTVSDHGPGIEEVDLPHLFEPFYRGQSASYGGRRGNGLGLSFVKRIVEAHGGRVTVETEPGRGSAFTVHVKTVEGEAESQTS